MNERQGGRSWPFSLGFVTYRVIGKITVDDYCRRKSLAVVELGPMLCNG